MKSFWRDKRSIFASFILFFFMGLALFAPWIAPYQMEEREISLRLCEISSSHLLGCDLNGADVLSSLIYGGRVSLFIGISTLLISLVVGTSIGLFTGYLGGRWDYLTMRVVDILMAFPGILLALFMTAMLGPSLKNIIFAISVTGWIGFARLVRGQVLSLKNLEHVEAARAIGLGSIPIILRHLFPLLLAPLIIHATFTLSGIIIVESSLSFLGLGPQGEIASWGELLSQGKEVLVEAPLLTIVPGLAIMLCVLALNFFGDALRDFLDPRSQVGL